MFGSNGCDIIFASRFRKRGIVLGKVMLKSELSERKVLSGSEV